MLKVAMANRKCYLHHHRNKKDDGHQQHDYHLSKFILEYGGHKVIAEFDVCEVRSHVIRFCVAAAAAEANVV